MNATDENDILHDSEFSFKFGETEYTLHALPVEKSVKWSRTVREFLVSSAQQTVAQMKRLRAESTDFSDPKLVEELIGAFDNEAILKLRDFVAAYSPNTLKVETVNGWTARQLAFVFLKMYKVENPFEEVQRSLQAMKS